MKELFASKSVIKAAIFDVIDQGRNQSAEYQDWCFSDSDSDYELRERAVFADAVIRRISELQSSPHQGVKLEEARRLTSGVERRQKTEEKAAGA